MSPEAQSNEVAFLSVGYRVLDKDAMDQAIRSFGNHRTYYAQNAAVARRVLSETNVDVIILEHDLGDTTAYGFIKLLHGDMRFKDIYFALALETDSPALKWLAQELDVRTRLIKPISAPAVKEMLDSYFAWRDAPKTDALSMLHAARVAYIEKRYVDAERIYRLGIQSHPENVAIFQKAGAFYLQKPDLAEAERLLEKALSVDPNYVPALSTLGAVQMRKKEYGKAFEYLSRAQEASPLNPDRALLLAKLHMLWASEEIREVQKSDPRDLDLHFEQGKLLVFLRDYAGGLEEFRKYRYPTNYPQLREIQALVQLASKIGGLK